MAARSMPGAVLHGPESRVFRCLEFADVVRGGRKRSSAARLGVPPLSRLGSTTTNQDGRSWEHRRRRPLVQASHNCRTTACWACASCAPETWTICTPPVALAPSACPWFATLGQLRHSSRHGVARAKCRSPQKKKKKKTRRIVSAPPVAPPGLIECPGSGSNVRSTRIGVRLSRLRVDRPRAGERNVLRPSAPLHRGPKFATNGATGGWRMPGSVGQGRCVSPQPRPIPAQIVSEKKKKTDFCGGTTSPSSPTMVPQTSTSRLRATGMPQAHASPDRVGKILRRGRRQAWRCSDGICRPPSGAESRPPHTTRSYKCERIRQRLQLIAIGGRPIPPTPRNVHRDLWRAKLAAGAEQLVFLSIGSSRPRSRITKRVMGNFPCARSARARPPLGRIVSVSRQSKKKRKAPIGDPTAMRSGRHGRRADRIGAPTARAIRE